MVQKLGKTTRGMFEKALDALREEDYDTLRNANVSRYSAVLAELAKGPKGTDFIDELARVSHAACLAHYSGNYDPDGDPLETHRVLVRAVLKRMGLPTDEA